MTAKLRAKFECHTAGAQTSTFGGQHYATPSPPSLLPEVTKRFATTAPHLLMNLFSEIAMRHTGCSSPVSTLHAIASAANPAIVQPSKVANVVAVKPHFWQPSLDLQSFPAFARSPPAICGECFHCHTWPRKQQF
jgi:hypothetical protein